MIRLLYAISLSIVIAVILAHGAAYSDSDQVPDMTVAMHNEVAD